MNLSVRKSAPKVLKKVCTAKVLLDRFLKTKDENAKDMVCWKNNCIAASATMGGRSYMEDRHVVVKDGDALFCAIYDGHNGSFAAQYAADKLYDKLKLNMKTNSDVQLAMMCTFKEIEKEILKLTVRGKRRDGATALVAYMEEDQIFVGNIGDTRAVLGNRNAGAIRVSVDHKPNVGEEKSRVEKAGGEIIFSGCWRVAHERVSVRLAVSRAFGDHPLKLNLPSSCTGPLVSAVPEMNVIKVSKEDEFLILASDGVWDRISDEQAVEIVRETMAKEDKNCAMKKAADNIVQIALKNRSMDNITVIVIALNQ